MNRQQRYDLFLQNAQIFAALDTWDGEACSPGCPGWAIMDVNREPFTEVERCDACARFDDDDQALNHVLRAVFPEPECDDRKCILCRRRLAGCCTCGDCDDCKEQYNENGSAVCYHCSLTLNPSDCGRADVAATWVDSCGHVGDDVRMICRDCLDAGDPSGPGYREMEREGAEKPVDSNGETEAVWVCEKCNGGNLEVTASVNLATGVVDYSSWETGDVYCLDCDERVAAELQNAPHDNKQGKHSPAGTYHCPECGSTEVHGTAWIELNTNKLTGDEQPMEHYWCCACGEREEDGNLSRLCFSDGAGKCQWCSDPIKGGKQ